MWTTVLVMAISVIFEPMRIALVVLMLNRPRPILQLLSFLCGGFTTCLGFGLVAVFVLRATPMLGSHPVAKTHIAIGLLVLLIAMVLATNVSVRTVIPRTRASTAVEGDAGVIVVEPAPPNSLEKLSTCARDLLQNSSLWVAGVSGALNLPSANYMAALAVIVASGAAPAAEVTTLLMFNVVAFTLVGIPLLSYLAAPQKTRAFTAALQAWVRSRRRRDVAAVLGTAGCVMLALGISGL
ncbi:MAG: GAP family protein [Mycobacterium sp.]